MNINIYQTIFLLFYTLYSAMTIAAAGKTQPFDTPSMFKGYIKAWIRFVVSFLILNVVPLLSFVLVFNIFDNFSNSKLTIHSVFIVFLPSLTGLGFYRIHYGVMLLKYKKRYIFYDKSLYEKKTKYLPSSLFTDLESRPKHHTEPATHIVPGVIWVFMSLLPIFFIH